MSVDLSELNLSMQPQQFDEETWLISVPSPSNEKGAIGIGDGVSKLDGNVREDDDEKLDEWLEGALKKVDFRTRSALSRRLDKKRRSFS